MELFGRSRIFCFTSGDSTGSLWNSCLKICYKISDTHSGAHNKTFISLLTHNTQLVSPSTFNTPAVYRPTAGWPAIITTAITEAKLFTWTNWNISNLNSQYATESKLRNFWKCRDAWLEYPPNSAFTIELSAWPAVHSVREINNIKFVGPIWSPVLLHANLSSHYWLWLITIYILSPLSLNSLQPTPQYL